MATGCEDSASKKTEGAPIHRSFHLCLVNQGSSLGPTEGPSGAVRKGSPGQWIGKAEAEE